MSGSRLLKTLAALCLAAIVATNLAGCTPEMQSLMMEYKDDWVAKKTKEVGIGGMVTGVLWGTTGDDEADAALDAYTAVKSIVEGDKLIERAQYAMDMGRHTGRLGHSQRGPPGPTQRLVVHVQGDGVGVRCGRFG